VSNQKDFPEILSGVLKGPAESLKHSLETLSYPNSNRKGAPFNESNVTAHFVAALKHEIKDAAFYLEVPIKNGRRIDLVAAWEGTALVMEAKVFGPIASRCESLRNQLIDMRSFLPSCAPAGDLQSRSWWDKAESRLGIVLLGNHRDDVRVGWRNGNSSEFEDLQDGLAVQELIRELGDAEFGCEPILKAGRFGKNDGRLDLLWAIFSLADESVIEKVG
jgi:hypothetical protein